MGWTDLLDKKNKKIGIVGDQGWDMAGDFVEEFQKMYKKEIGRPATLDEITSSVEFVYNTSTEKEEEVEKPATMYATCLNNDGVDLVVDKEYIIKEVNSFDGIADKCFYILEDGLAYSRSHFTVTYLK